MDYLDIVLKGYSDLNTNKHFSTYLERECKKAEQQFYTRDEFFEGCISALKTLNNENFERFYNRRNELYILKDLALNDGLSYSGLKEGETKEEYRNDTLKSCEEELSIKEPFGYSLPLAIITKGKYIGHLSYEEIKRLQNEIKDVWLIDDFEYFGKKLNGFDLISLKQNLNVFYNRTERKDEFLDWLELSYLKTTKVIFNTDEIYKDNAFGLGALLSEKIQFIEKWLNDKTKSRTTTIEPESIDLSNTKAIDKIIYLHELGILEMLRNKAPFNTSVNSLSTVLSAITGEKTGTLTPYLNPMFSPNTAQKNNPLESQKAVSRVKDKLIDLGFKPE